jgi:hypothetical protein
MMNMMNRFVEGRGHKREIDMLLEITYVSSSSALPLNTHHHPQQTSGRPNNLRSR